jgi:hypothetical protein
MAARLAQKGVRPLKMEAVGSARLYKYVGVTSDRLLEVGIWVV